MNTSYTVTADDKERVVPVTAGTMPLVVEVDVSVDAAAAAAVKGLRKRLINISKGDRGKQAKPKDYQIVELNQSAGGQIVAERDGFGPALKPDGTFKNVQHQKPLLTGPLAS